MGEVEGVRSHKKVDSPKLSPQKKLTDSHFACKFRSMLRVFVSIFGSKFLMYTAFFGGCSRIHRKLRDGKGSIPLYILTYTYYYVCMCIYIYVCCQFTAHSRCDHHVQSPQPGFGVQRPWVRWVFGLCHRIAVSARCGYW